MGVDRPVGPHTSLGGPKTLDIMGWRAWEPAESCSQANPGSAPTSSTPYTGPLNPNYRLRSLYFLICKWRSWLFPQ